MSPGSFTQARPERAPRRANAAEVVPVVGWDGAPVVQLDRENDREADSDQPHGKRKPADAAWTSPQSTLRSIASDG
jgi:hypothetical protein